MFTDSPDEALSHRLEVHGLFVSPAGTTPWQQLVPDLPRLETLVIAEGVDADPTPVAHWPEGLQALGLHLPEEGAERLLAAWARAVPGLERLTVEVHALPSPTLPATLGDFPALTELVVKSERAVELPIGLAGGPCAP